MSSKTEQVKAVLEKLGHEPSVEEKKNIAKEKGCSVALVHKVLTRMPKPEPTGIPASVEPVVRVEEQETKEVPAEEEAPPPTLPSPPKEREGELERIVERVEAGILTSEDLTYVWSSVNSLFPQKHQRPERSMQLLGKLWVKPANRLIEKYAVENVDLYLALGITALTFAPCIIGMVRERKKPEKKVSEEIVT